MSGFDANQASLSLFKKDIAGTIQEIPKGDRDIIEERIQEIKEVFYETEPKEHYPYL